MLNFFSYALWCSVCTFFSLTANDQSLERVVGKVGLIESLRPWQESSRIQKPEIVRQDCSQRLYTLISSGCSQLIGYPKISVHPHDMRALKLLMSGITSEIDYHEDVARCVRGIEDLQGVISEVESHIVRLSESEEPFIAHSVSKQLLGADVLFCKLLQAVRSQASASWLEHSSITYREMQAGLELARMLMWRMPDSFSKTRSLQPVIFDGDRAPRAFNMCSMVIAGRGHEDCIVQGGSHQGVVMAERVISDLSESDILVHTAIEAMPDASWTLVFDGHKVDPRWKTSVKPMFLGCRCQNETVLWASERLNRLLVESVVRCVENPLREACEALRHELSSVYKEDWFDGTTITAFLNYKGTYYCAQLGDSGFLIATPEGYCFSGMHRLSNPKEKEYILAKSVRKELADLVDYEQGRVAGFALTRTFGDLWHHAVARSHDALVRDAFEYTELPGDTKIDALIIGTDGLWDELSADAVALLLQDLIRDENTAEDMLSLIKQQLDCLLPHRYQDHDDVACVVITPEIK